MIHSRVLYCTDLSLKPALHLRLAPLMCEVGLVVRTIIRTYSHSTCAVRLGGLAPACPIIPGVIAMM